MNRLKVVLRGKRPQAGVALRGKDLRAIAIDENGNEFVLPFVNARFECNGRQDEASLKLVTEVLIEEVDVELDPSQVTEKPDR